MTAIFHLDTIGTQPVADTNKMYGVLQTKVMMTATSDRATTNANKMQLFL